MYRGVLDAAIARTLRWGIDEPIVKVFGILRGPDDYRHSGNADIRAFVQHQSQTMGLRPEMRRKLCAPVHIVFAAHALGALPPVCYPMLTIGDVMLEGEPCFGTSKSSLKRELARAGRAEGAVDAHVWLTMMDGSIIDLTLPFWLANQSCQATDPHRDEVKGFYFCSPDSIPGLVYRPWLVGVEFPKLTKWCNGRQIRQYEASLQRVLQNTLTPGLFE